MNSIKFQPIISNHEKTSTTHKNFIKKIHFPIFPNPSTCWEHSKRCRCHSTCSYFENFPLGPKTINWRAARFFHYVRGSLKKLAGKDRKVSKAQTADFPRSRFPCTLGGFTWPQKFSLVRNKENLLGVLFNSVAETIRGVRRANSVIFDHKMYIYIWKKCFWI